MEDHQSENLTALSAWGLRCPSCGLPAALDIAATVWIRLCPNGSDTQLAPYGDHEWTDDSLASCTGCGHQARVGEFRCDLEAGEAAR